MSTSESAPVHGRANVLEWRSDGHNGQSIVAAAFGIEVFYWVHGKPNDWTLTIPGARDYVHTPGYETRAAAQYAAKVDYFRRLTAEVRFLSSDADLSADIPDFRAFAGAMRVAAISEGAKADAYRRKRDDWKDRAQNLANEIAAAEDRYQRDCLGLNNEGDLIGGDPPVGWKARAEKAEAERDAIAAATVEGMKDRLRKVVTFSRDAALIRDMDFTPADAKAALDAMIEGAAMTECAAFSAGYEACERDGKSAALTAQPVAQEPVAWLYEGKVFESERAAKHACTCEGLTEDRILPVYAHPATPAPTEAGLRQSIVDLLDCWDMFGLGEIKASLTKYVDRAQSAPVAQPPICEKSQTADLPPPGWIDGEGS